MSTNKDVPGLLNKYQKMYDNLWAEFESMDQELDTEDNLKGVVPRETLSSGEPNINDTSSSIASPSKLDPLQFVPTPPVKKIPNKRPTPRVITQEGGPLPSPTISPSGSITPNSQVDSLSAPNQPSPIGITRPYSKHVVGNDEARNIGKPHKDLLADLQKAQATSNIITTSSIKSPTKSVNTPLKLKTPPSTPTNIPTLKPTEPETLKPSSPVPIQRKHSATNNTIATSSDIAGHIMLMSKSASKRRLLEEEEASKDPWGRKPEDAQSSAQSIFEGSHDELLYNHEVLDAIFSHIPMGIILINAYGVVRAYSKGAERMFIYPSYEVIGENVSLFSNESVRKRHDYYLSRARLRIASRLSSTLGVDATEVTLDNVVVQDPNLSKIVVNTITSSQLMAGQKRELLGVDKLGSCFPLEMNLSCIYVPNQVYFMGYLVDVRDLTSFQNLTVKQEMLLRSILDSTSITRLMSGEKIIKDHFTGASVMFCDVVDYTAKSVKLNNEEYVAQFLNEIFGIFDKIVVGTESMKIKTIGDVYMVATGVPSSQKEHAKILVELGISLMKDGAETYNKYVMDNKSIESLLYSSSSVGGEEKVRRNTKHGRSGHNEWRKQVVPLQLRMGINSGPLVGGIFSQVKGGYDLYGATVNKAQRLEMTCRPMSIHMSGDTKSLLPEYLSEMTAVRYKTNLKGFPPEDTYELSHASAMNHTRKVVDQEDKNEFGLQLPTAGPS